MTEDTGLPEEPLKDRHVVELEKRTPDEVADRAVDELDLKGKRALAKYAIRCGLGEHFAQLHAGDLDRRDLEPDELGAVMSISFDADDDPVHDDLLKTLLERQRAIEPPVPDRCPRCGCEWWKSRARVLGASLEPYTPIECDDCGFEPDLEGRRDVGGDA